MIKILHIIWYFLHFIYILHLETKPHHKLIHLQVILGLLRVYTFFTWSLPQFQGMGKKAERIQKPKHFLHLTRPRSTIIWWICYATYSSFSEVHNLVPHLFACFRCLLFWLACWFGPCCSTWRLWPMSTSAMERSSTVWTSWSTWHVSIIVGTQTTLCTC